VTTNSRHLPPSDRRPPPQQAGAVTQPMVANATVAPSSPAGYVHCMQRLLATAVNNNNRTNLRANNRARPMRDCAQGR